MGSCTSAPSNTKTDESSVLTPLTKADVDLINSSWKIVAKEGFVKYGTNMMCRIFLEHKHLKPLWRFSYGLETMDQMQANQMLKAHGEKLFSTIDVAISMLDDLNSLIPVLIQLGYSHHKYGVKEEHFPVIGTCLIETLADGLKDEFTPKVKLAWMKLFGVVEAQMKVGMRQAESTQKSMSMSPVVSPALTNAVKNSTQVYDQNATNTTPTVTTTTTNSNGYNTTSNDTQNLA